MFHMYVKGSAEHNIDQAILALSTTWKRRNQDYVFFVALDVTIMSIDGKR